MLDATDGDELPMTLVATTVTEYVAPPTNPEIAHWVDVAVHDTVASVVLVATAV
jgi:hypothetical protein